MESSTVILFFEKCRLCLERQGVHNIIGEENLQDDVLYYTGVKVFLSDNLPQKICSICSKIITKTKELRLLATKNDTYLRSLFSNDSDSDTYQDPVKITDVNVDSSQQSQEVQSTLFEPSVILETQKEPDTNITTISEPTQSKTTIRVRKDLMEPSSSSSSSTKSSLKVSSKSEYEEAKKKIKIENDSEVVYQCGLCSKQFETWKKLYLHTRGHNKSHCCPLDACGKKFATKGDLEKHLRTHTGIRPYSCDICDKSFTQKGVLKSHKEHVHNSFTF